MTEPRFYQIKKGFATHNNLLIYFAARPLAETEKAVYLFGHGTTESRKTGVCMKCGRTLTHPVSVELGIGPECGKHYHDWDLIGGYTPENLERLKGALVDIKVDTWIPKSAIIETGETKEIIIVPNDHKMLNKENIKKPVRWAGLTTDGEGNKLIKIMFPFNDEDLMHVRSLPSRKWNKDEKFWTVPFTMQSAKELQSWGFMLGEKLVEMMEKVLETMTNPKPLKPKDLVIPGLGGTLRPFQEEGVVLIDKHNGRALVADEMGLGKTIETLAWAQLHPEIERIIAIVPASVKRNWEKEAMIWMNNPKVQILFGGKPYPITGKFLIINYDILPKWLEALRAFKAQLLILDEAHFIKNNAALRTKAVKVLAKGIPKLLALTGTPIENRPVEIYNAIKLVNPSLIPSFWAFAQRYCGAKHNGYGWDFSGASNTQELNALLRGTIMIRRLKKDVLTELPDKVYGHIPMELDNEKEYNAAEDDFIAYIHGTKGEEAAIKASNAIAFSKIEMLKQLAVKGKLEQATNWISDFLESDEKLVVFAHHKFVIDALMMKFEKIALKIDGSVPVDKRQGLVERFQTDKDVKLFIISEAGGVGITLTAASNIVVLELPWTPGSLDQIIDRLHRIGQKFAVNIHFLLAAGTIEEKIAMLLDKKRKIVNSVLNGEEGEQESMLAEIMKLY